MIPPDIIGTRTGRAAFLARHQLSSWRVTFAPPPAAARRASPPCLTSQVDVAPQPRGVPVSASAQSLNR